MERGNEATASPDLTAMSALAEARVHLIGAVTCLIGLGLTMVYAASATRAARLDWPLHYVERQAAYLVAGVIAMWCMSRCNPAWLARLRWPLLAAGLGGLVAVLIPGVGSRVNGASRWIRLAGVSVQPSELAKTLVVASLAGFLATSRTGSRRRRWLRDIFPLCIAGVTAGLIALEPDIGTAALVGTVLAAMIFTSGASLLFLGLCALAVAPVAAWALLHKLDYVVARILAWWTGDISGKGYHAWVSVTSIASGGWEGVGLGRGSASLWRLPEAHNDFIFAVAAQELGLVCSLAILVAFTVIVISGMRIARHAPDAFSRLLAFGITLTIGLQAAMNIAVVTASMPTKGIPLPFVSAGGSSLVCSCLAVGILAGISRHGCRVAVRAEEMLPELDQLPPWSAVVTAARLRQQGDEGEAEDPVRHAA